MYLRVLAILLVLASRALCQNSWNAVEQLKQDQRLRIFTASTESVRGRLISATGQGVTLSVKRNAVTWRRDEISRVTAPSGLRRLRNTLIGLGIGAGLGAAVAYAGFGDAPKLAPLMTASVICGAGAAIGAVVPADRTVYRRP